MEEFDVFARIIHDYGPPQHPLRVSSQVTKMFGNRLPKAILDFWLAHGWGVYKNGFFRMCDPRPFDPLLKLIFRGDPEFDASDMSVVGYTVFNRLKVWNRTGRTMLIDLEELEVGGGGNVETNPDTGQPYSEAFLIGSLFYNELSIKNQDYYYQACAKLGLPDPDEVFGYAPALHLGGEWGLDHLQRFKTIEHMTFLSQLDPPMLTELSAPQPDAPLGRIYNVRRIGPQQALQ